MIGGGHHAHEHVSHHLIAKSLIRQACTLRLKPVDGGKDPAADFLCGASCLYPGAGADKHEHTCLKKQRQRFICFAGELGGGHGGNNRRCHSLVEGRQKGASFGNKAYYRLPAIWNCRRKGKIKFGCHIPVLSINFPQPSLKVGHGASDKTALPQSCQTGVMIRGSYSPFQSG